MTKITLDQSVLDSIPPLVSGAHDDSSDVVCAMEALARACGLGTTDHPECTSPVIGAFTRSLNDSLPTDDLRDRLIRPLLPLMVGTAGDGHDEDRMWLATDHSVRVFAANALEIAGLEHEAKTLRALSPITNKSAARSAAESAAWSAAESAASAAASAAWSENQIYEQAADLLRQMCLVGK